MKQPKAAVTGLRRRLRGMSQRTVGLIIACVFVVVTVMIFNKERAVTQLSEIFHPSDTISAEFERGYKLLAYNSEVKLGGVVVGKVTGVERADKGRSLVTLHLRDGVRDKLGTTPAAGIRPTTLLGGKYYVDLRPGGRGEFESGHIPVTRTTIPVELDRVLSAITPSARDGVRASIEQTDKTLADGGRKAVRDLLRNAPGTLRPAADVLEAGRGTRPGKDLAELVGGLESFAEGMSRRDGHLADIVSTLDTSMRAMAAETAPLAESVRTMPATLRATRAGLADLAPTLDRVTTMADSLRPSVTELDALLGELDPVLARTRPLLDDLRPLLRDLSPVADRLVRATRKSTELLDDVRGPVLDRVAGPITDLVMSPWRGTGQYEGGGSSGNRFYEEAGYLASRASQVYGWNDESGGFVRMSLGMGGNSAGGFGMSAQQYLEMLGLAEPPGPGESDDLPLPPAELGAPK